MLKSFFFKNNIRFQRKNRTRILLLLVMFVLVELYWKLKKRCFGIQRPVIHLYAVGWNEAKILPFVLKYYMFFVDHFYIYDNYSDDESDEILKTYPQVTVRKFDTGGTFNDVVHQQIKNSVWKQSRGKADWVMVIDMDELIYHPQLINFLQQSKNTIFIPYGYNMVTDIFPKYDKLITEQVKYGIPDSKYSKMVLFNPHKIVEINYEPGAHEAYPEGIIEINLNEELKLLHFKNLGVDYVLSKINDYRNRLSKQNKENNHGIEYERPDEIIINEILDSVKKSIQIIE